MSPTPTGSLPIVLGVVFIDLLGFGMIVPLLPFYAETFGASATVVGLLVASYAFGQLAGAPVLGALSDRVGRKPVLVVSVIGTAMGFVIFGMATTLWVLFASRILDGVTGGNVSVAQAYVSDVSTPATRARNFGFIGAAFGVGFILGPAMGGFLSRWGYATPAFVAAGMAALNALAILLFLPESHPLEARARKDGSGAAGSPRETGGRVDAAPSGWRHLMAGGRAGGLLWLRFWFMMAFVTYALIFALWAQYRLQVDAETTGYILGYVGVLIVLVQGGLVGLVSKRVAEGRVLLFAIGLMAVSLAAWSQVETIPLLLVVQVPIAVAAGLFGATLNSALAHAVVPREVGTVLGIGASLESLTRALAPTLGGVLLDRAGTWAPGAFGAALLLLLFPFALRVVRRSAPQDAPRTVRSS